MEELNDFLQISDELKIKGLFQNAKDSQVFGPASVAKISSYSPSERQIEDLKDSHQLKIKEWIKNYKESQKRFEDNIERGEPDSSSSLARQMVCIDTVQTTQTFFHFTVKLWGSIKV